MKEKIPTFGAQTTLGFHPCKCGCGALVPPWNDFVRGHTFRVFPTYIHADRSQTQRGIWASYSPKGKEIRLQDSVLSEESIQKSRETQKKQWEELSPEEKKKKLQRSFQSEKAREAASQATSERTLGKFGSDHPGWKGGHTYGYGYGWSAIREIILIRDGFTCQNCGRQIRLQVHHIDRNTDNVEEHNLITLCEWCNHKASRWAEQDYWQAIYQKIIEEIYEVVA